MKKFYKIFGILCGVTMALGILIIVIFGLSGGTDGYLVISSGKVTVERSYENSERKNNVTEPFKNIEINTDIGNIELIYGDEYKVVYNVPNAAGKLNYQVSDGKLRIWQKEESGRIIIPMSFGFFKDMKNKDIYIKVYIPRDAVLDTVKIDNNMGIINVDGFSMDKIIVNNSMGDVKILNSDINDIDLEIDAGSVHIENINCKKIINADVDMGYVNISGKLDCNLNLSADMGSINVQTGNQKEYYDYDFEADMGSIEYYNENFSGKTRRNNGAKYNIDGRCDMGSIKICR